ncbi:MAG TPA: peptidoglycan-binding domain-containing protein [Acidimicrobiales bacterium]|nr:peptidoglycan-binding domain-containing protein [Acidimicrobiales bacterium]
MLMLQRRPVALRYWLGPVNGSHGDSTEQAVYTRQKSPGLAPDGIVGPKTEGALRRGVKARGVASNVALYC